MNLFGVSFQRVLPSSLSMNKLMAIICVLIIGASIVSAKPVIVNRQKRQSDQRLAELETLLALQKYNGHRVRGWQSHNDLPPGFGLIDFEKIGRKKKSTRFSPGFSVSNKDLHSSWLPEFSSTRNELEKLAEVSK